jgi:hypothetical protein
MYSVVEEQPSGFFHGGQMVGSGTGTIVGPDHIGGIQVNSAVELVDYNFCEILPASLSGHVYVDLDNDGNRDAGEQPIGGVTLQLLDANGTFAGRTTITDANGFYKFDNLMPGTWGVAEVQPAGWRDGKDTPGTAGGVALPTPGDKITGSHLDPDEDALEYNFGERPLPGSLRGIVFVDPDQDCIYDAGESPIANVVVELLDANGAVVRVTTTNAQGQYEFTDIEPGQYSVRERQPDGFFQGGTTVGSGGGEMGEDIITAIDIGANAHLVDYNFCEIPPGTISGYVFQDGPAIEVTDPEAPLNINDYRDGKLTPDDTLLGGVTLELRNGVNGEPILGSAALPGTYNPSQPIRVVTRSDGYYEFVGLSPGNYGVFEVQPASFIDSRDTAGEIDAHQVGVAVNQFDAFIEDVLELLTVPHQFDAILRIQLPAGTDSTLNNFSEVKIQSIPIDLIPPPAPLPPPPPPVVISPPPEAPRMVFEPLIEKLAGLRLQGSGANGYTWHLSVVNAGFPRGLQERTDVIVQNIAMRMEQQAFAGRKLNESSWTLPGATPGTTRKVNFGLRHSKAVVGDFNGDGISDIAVFQDGQWFIDLNGNGVWDENDLWAKLGHKDDRPVAGDWDGDGKDDIGIFGPAWPGDPRAIEAEPGLPDPMNLPQGKAKNLPPLPQEAAIGARSLKLTSAGKLRADLIDHVFHYGTATDVPIVGDWNGDGVTTIGIFRDGAWRLDVDGDGHWSKGDLALEFGQAGDKPVIGDWNGDGIDDLGVYRNGAFVLDSNGDHVLDDRDTQIDMHGTADDQPVAGDFDGDGHDEPALYHDGGGVQTASADGAAATTP